jgi:LAO/AO transport system kinase
MQGLSRDEGVYIRSMATRGQLGGLAPTTHDVVTILDAAGYDVVITETVGVGQDEVEIARLADVTALLLVPGMGDDVQTFKAGVMEIADVFVVNKADRPGAERVAQEVTAMLSIAPRRDGWQPPILQTVATTGDGVTQVHQALEKFRSFGVETPLRLERQRAHSRARLLEMLRQRLFEKVAAEQLRDGSVDRHVEDIVARRSDPYSVVEEIIEKSNVESRTGSRNSTAKNRKC